MELISTTLTSAICEQIGHEMLNASIYLHICGFLRNKGLNKIAEHFEGQHTEEISHSKMFFDLLTDLNAPVTLPEVSGVNTSYLTIMDIATIYLDREVLTTNSINQIKNLAVEENNPVVEEMLREMIRLQRKEYEEATSFMDLATLLPEWWMQALYRG
jgi:ferritin